TPTATSRPTPASPKRRARMVSSTPSSSTSSSASHSYEDPDMHLRPLRSDDRPFLLEILHDTPEFSRAEIACAIEVIDEAITQPEKGDYRCLVAVDDEAAVVEIGRAHV